MGMGNASLGGGAVKAHPLSVEIQPMIAIFCIYSKRVIMIAKIISITKIGTKNRINPKARTIEYNSGVTGRKKDRRNKQYDRRKSVRDGVIVSLSFKKDRRKNPDRRHVQSSGGFVSANNSKGSIYDVHG